MGSDELKKAAEMSESVATKLRESMKPFETAAEKMRESMRPVTEAAEKMRLLSDAIKIPQAIEIDQMFKLPPMPIDPNLASEFKRRLVKWVQDFDASLDADHEVGARLVSFGPTVTIHLSEIANWNPSLIVFRGILENGDPAELIQHVSQISVLLVKVKRLDLTAPKQPIGFVWDANESGR